MTLALVSAADFFHLDEDLAVLCQALADRGIATEVVDWHDPTVAWGSFSAAVLRSPWDYTWHLAEFLDWAERVAAVTALANPLSVIRWNTDKHYLLDLERKGVPIVPTQVVEPCERIEAELLWAQLEGGRADEIVVKPVVSAGGRDTERFGRDELEAATGHARRLLDAGRSVLIQPYLRSVDERGETAVVFAGDRLTHGFSKGPILVPGVGFVEGVYREERIEPRQPSPAEAEAAQRALDAMSACVPGHDRRDLLYARVDLVLDERGEPRILELELIEPSLFLRYIPDAIDAVADAFARFVHDCEGRSAEARSPNS
ncbi:MAG: hypothetical protein N2037_08785 [Acidimicrobiales bacterium]|nr:hypothetical protein [Acidimicrobiales bacterium]